MKSKPDQTVHSKFYLETNLKLILECPVVRQLIEYLTSSDLLPTLQSGFRSGHSTETAVLHVLSAILEAVDKGNVCILALLDLSAAFDTDAHR